MFIACKKIIHFENFYEISITSVHRKKEKRRVVKSLVFRFFQNTKSNTRKSIINLFFSTVLNVKNVFYLKLYRIIKHKYLYQFLIFLFLRIYIFVLASKYNIL